MTEPVQPESAAEVEAQASLEQLSDAPAPAATPSAGLIRKWLGSPNAPLWIAGVVLVAALGFAGYKHLPRIGGAPNVVVFDPVRFINAQRAAASILSTQPNADLALTMTQVAKKAEAVILEEADGAVILVKQAVVAPETLRDITDDVLKRFGLPTKVPTVTVSPTLSLESLAPTDSSFSPGALREDYRMELEKRSLDAAVAEEKKSAQERLIP